MPNSFSRAIDNAQRPSSHVRFTVALSHRIKSSHHPQSYRNMISQALSVRYIRRADLLRLLRRLFGEAFEIEVNALTITLLDHH